MPIIFYTLAAVAFMPIVIAWVCGYFRVKQLGKFDNEHPRQQQAQLTGPGARAMGAQNNAWEALGMYTAVCFVAYASGLPLQQLDTVSLVFLATRLLHPVFYVANLAALRSLVFLGGFGCCVYITYLSLMFVPTVP